MSDDVIEEERPLRVLIIAGSARRLHSCPGLDSKARALMHRMTAMLPAGWQIDHEDIGNQHGKARNEPSMTKVFCSEALGRVVDRCLQILGAIGITRDTVVERIYRDIRPFRIYDGPSEVHRHVLARRVLAQNDPMRR